MASILLKVSKSQAAVKSRPRRYHESLLPRFLLLAAPLLLLVFALGAAALELFGLAPDLGPLAARGVARPEGLPATIRLATWAFEGLALLALFLLLWGRTPRWWLDGLAAGASAWTFRGPLLVLAVAGHPSAGRPVLATGEGRPGRRSRRRARPRPPGAQHSERRAPMSAPAPEAVDGGNGQAPAATLATIAAVGSAFPRHYYDQETLLAALRGYWEQRYFNLDRIEQLHKNVLVGGRHLALPIEEYPGLTTFGQSNSAWIRVAEEIGGEALLAALGSAASRRPTSTRSSSSPSPASRRRRSTPA